VIDLDVAPAPLVYFGLQREPGLSGAVFSISHDPAGHHDIKLVLRRRAGNAGAGSGLYRRIRAVICSEATADYRQEALADGYIRRRRAKTWPSPDHCGW
jgi:phosphomannomutase